MLNKVHGQNCEPGTQCVALNQWQLGVAIGLGFNSNPLIGGDNIPLLVVPDIAWYGESVYFDNGELGYQWLTSPRLSMVSFISLDSERAYFSFWHPANILGSASRFSQIADSDTESDSLIGPQRISIDDVASRDWAVMAGLRWYFYQPEGEWQLSIAQDVSSVHQGHVAEFSYQHQWQWQSFQLSAQVKMQWKSSRLYDYYYGISKRDNVDPIFYYHAKAGWQPKLSATLQKPINSEWLWLTRLSYQLLPDSMTASPLIEERNIYSVFSGFAYQF